MLCGGDTNKLHGSGTAEWEGGAKGPKSEALIYWHTPEDWANLIWNWVKCRAPSLACCRMHLTKNPSRLMRRVKITKL